MHLLAVLMYEYYAGHRHRPIAKIIVSFISFALSLSRGNLSSATYKIAEYKGGLCFLTFSISTCSVCGAAFDDLHCQYIHGIREYSRYLWPPSGLDGLKKGTRSESRKYT